MTLLGACDPTSAEMHIAASPTADHCAATTIVSGSRQFSTASAVAVLSGKVPPQGRFFVSYKIAHRMEIPLHLNSLDSF
jgi:hypothetical protein